jgi:hypothetical protein
LIFKTTKTEQEIFMILTIICSMCEFMLKKSRYAQALKKKKSVSTLSLTCLVLPWPWSSTVGPGWSPRSSPETKHTSLSVKKCKMSNSCIYKAIGSENVAKMKKVLQCDGIYNMHHTLCLHSTNQNKKYLVYIIIYVPVRLTIQWLTEWWARRRNLMKLTWMLNKLM